MPVIPNCKCQSGPFGDGPLCSPITSNAADATEVRFTGKERDTESGNDYLMARYYSSAMGRFMSPDWSAQTEPVPYAKLSNPQSLNLYGYVGNNPLLAVDADGHCAGLRPGMSDMVGCDPSNGNGDPLREGEERFDRNEAATVAAAQEQRASSVAASQAGSMQYSVNGSTVSASGQIYHRGDKCNEFVCDIYQRITGHRAQVPYSDFRGWLLGWKRDPSAKEWATMPIQGYSAPLPLSEASPGDVIAMAHHDDSDGHVGIYVGFGQTASVNALQGGRITVNDWGFRGAGQNGEHAGDNGPVVRKWIGLP